MGTILTVTVIGAAGAAWPLAYLVARGGYRTVLEDISGQRATEAFQAVRSIADNEVSAGRLTTAQAVDLLSRIEPATALDRAVAEADLVIEAVPDDLETKTEVYAILNVAARPACIITTMARWPLAEIARLTYRPLLVVGMRISEPLLNAPETEVIAGPHTAAHATAAVEDLGRRMGKDVIFVREDERIPEVAHGTTKHQARKP